MPAMLTSREDLTFLSTKTYTHSVGLSCCFRQWRANSHCKYLHGYALEVKLVFTGTPDNKNWIVDFGSLKPVKEWLQSTFDHKLLVAEDDPELDTILNLYGIADVMEVKATGCEAFALLIYEFVEQWLSVALVAATPQLMSPVRNVQLLEVEVCEHAGNSAIVRSKSQA